MIELLLAAFFVFAVLARRAYKQLRRPYAVDLTVQRKHSRVAGVTFRALRRGYSPSYALLAVFGMALPRGGFTSAGVPVDPTVPKVGTTTAAGNVGGTTLIDTNAFTETSDTKWEGALILILSGSRQYELRAVHAYDHTTSTITVGKPFTGQVASGTKYALFADLGEAERILGANNANNAYDSSLVVANADGSTLERLEYVQALLLGNEPVTFSINSFPGVDEDGGRFIATVSIVDRNSGKIASGSIDITGVTYALKKSTGDAAFSTAGITQPAGATKATGRVDLEFAIVAGEWASGDSGQLEIDGITATVGGTTYYSGVLQWPFTILETLDVKTAVDATKVDTTAILADTGDGTDASVAPGVAGSLHAHVREAQEDLDTVLLDLAVPAADAATNTLLRDVLGNKNDAASTAATASLIALVRALGVEIVRTGTAQAGSTANTIVLDAGASATDNIYDPGLIVIYGGTGSGQSRRITQYTGATKVAVVDKDWRTTPDNTSKFLILADAGGLSVNEGLAQAGAATTITLNAQASAVNSVYNGQIVHLRSGTGQGQARIIVGYVGATKVATVSPAWDTNPDATTDYAVLPFLARAPTADATGAATVPETLGNKADVAVAAKSATASAIGYLKALIDGGGIVEGTVTGATNSTTFASTTTAIAALPTSGPIGATILFLTGVNAGEARILTNFTTGTGAMSFAIGYTSTPGVNDTFVLVMGVGNALVAPSADNTNSSNVLMNQVLGAKGDTRQYETAGSDLTTRTVMNILKGLSTAHIALQSAATGAGAADGSTIVDSGLTTVNFAGHKVMMVSGTAANLGVERVIQSISGTTLTVVQPFPAATANTDKYVILADATNKNLQITNAGTNLVASGSTAEQTLIDVATPVGGLIQVYVDLNALTQNATLKLYRKIDNSTYRSVKTFNTYISGTSDPGFYTDPFFTRNGFKLTITMAVNEGAARTTPYEILGNQGA